MGAKPRLRLRKYDGLLEIRPEGLEEMQLQRVNVSPAAPFCTAVPVSSGVRPMQLSHHDGSISSMLRVCMFAPHPPAWRQHQHDGPWWPPAMG